MRVSEDRYTRDRQRYDLAVRLIRHEARTHTIKEWTGLSDDRIRKLYRSYCLDGAHRRVARHRGKSPRQVAYFFKYQDLHFQAAQLASLYVIFGLVSGSSGPDFRPGSLESGVLLCRAYEEYRQLHTPAGISFEHAWFLLLALARREMGVARCEDCGAIRLRDLLARQRNTCEHCSWVPGTPLALRSQKSGESR